MFFIFSYIALASLALQSKLSYASFISKEEVNPSIIPLITCIFSLLTYLFFFAAPPLPASPGDALLIVVVMFLIFQSIFFTVAKTQNVGVFTYTPMTMALIIALIIGTDPWQGETFKHPYMSKHLIASLFSYTCFGIGSILSIMYLLLFKKLKTKNFDTTFQKLPPLDKLEKLLIHWAYLGCGGSVIATIFVVNWMQELHTDTSPILVWMLGLFPLIAYGLLLLLRNLKKIQGVKMVRLYLWILIVNVSLHALNVH